MTASFVSSSSLLSQAWQNVYDLLNSRTNVPDPVAASAEFRKMVYSREPDIKASDFAGFPYIIVRPAVLSFQDNETGRRQSRGVNFAIEVDVVASDRGSNNIDGKGAVHIDAISDDIVSTMLSAASRTTLATNGLRFSTPNVTGVVIEPLDNTMAYRRSFTLEFSGRKKVY